MDVITTTTEEVTYTTHDYSPRYGGYTVYGDWMKTPWYLRLRGDMKYRRLCEVKDEYGNTSHMGYEYSPY